MSNTQTKIQQPDADQGIHATQRIKRLYIYLLINLIKFSNMKSRRKGMMSFVVAL